MSNVWLTLIPLSLGSALVPIQIVITILVLRSSKLTAVAFVAGMTLVRLAQGFVFGLVLSNSDKSATSSSSGTSPVVGGVLLVVGVIFFVTAAHQLVTRQDPDAPPPRWMTMTKTMTPPKAFLLGVALIAIGAKFWVFTLGAVSAIGDADLGRAAAVGIFLVYVAVAESAHLAVLGIAAAAPERSAAVLERVSAWLERNNRVVVIVLGVVFGTWFVVKALNALGVL